MGFWVLGSRSWVLGIEVLYLILRLIFDIAIDIELNFYICIIKIKNK